MKVALDTTNILGRGTVRDTCNLLADGIVQLIRALAQLTGVNPTDGQVFRYSIDLNRKKKTRRQTKQVDKKAPARTPTKKQPGKPASGRTPDEVAATGEKKQATRREYDRSRNRTPERMEYSRRYERERRKRAWENEFIPHWLRTLRSSVPPQTDGRIRDLGYDDRLSKIALRCRP